MGMLEEIEGQGIVESCYMEPSSREGMMGMIAQSFGKSPIECDGMRVCFDGCSHHSGLQRLFIRCTEWDHGRCEKYLYLKDHPSANHAAAWLFAWQTLGWMAPDHIEHYGFDPEDDHIAEYLGKFGMMNYALFFTSTSIEQTDYVSHMNSARGVEE